MADSEEHWSQYYSKTYKHDKWELSLSYPFVLPHDNRYNSYMDVA